MITSTLRATAASLAVAAFIATPAFAAPPDFAGPPDIAGPKPGVPFQDLALANFGGSNSVTLNFGTPASAGEVLVVEFVSVTLTTDSGSTQAVVDLRVKSGGLVVSHRLVLTQQDSTGREVWLANQPILVFVDDTQTLEVFCNTVPTPTNDSVNGCSANVAGRIEEAD